jgi:predicted amidohydrolase YtcJ
MDQDIYAIALRDIKHTRVEMTIFDGTVVYDREGRT